MNGLRSGAGAVPALMRLAGITAAPSMRAPSFAPMAPQMQSASFACSGLSGAASGASGVDASSAGLEIFCHAKNAIIGITAKAIKEPNPKTEASASVKLEVSAIVPVVVDFIGVPTFDDTTNCELAPILLVKSIDSCSLKAHRLVIIGRARRMVGLCKALLQVTATNATAITN